MTIVAKFSPDSEIAKLKALGVTEREQPPWRVDDKAFPLNSREYDRQFRVITRGLKKRT